MKDIPIANTLERHSSPCKTNTWVPSSIQDTSYETMRGNGHMPEMEDHLHPVNNTCTGRPSFSSSEPQLLQPTAMHYG